MAPIDAVVIGHGHIGPRHVSILIQEPRIRQIIVVEKDISKHEEIRNRYPNKVKVVETLDEVDSGSVLHVCTPNGYHFKHSLWGLKKRMHVLCEKPFTLAYDESLQLIETAKQNNLYIACVLQNRFTPISQFLKKVVTESLLGEIFFIKVDCFWNRDERYYKDSDWRGRYDLDGGVLFTQFSHYIDIISWLFGRMTYSGEGSFWNFNHQYLDENWVDSGWFRFHVAKFPKVEGIFHFSTSCFQENLESSLTILGSKGTIKVGGQYMEKLLHCQLQDRIELPNFEPIEQNHYGAYKGSANMHAKVIQEFLERVFTQQYDYAEIQEVAEKVRFIQQVQNEAKQKCKYYNPIPQKLC